jgi:DNA polymerase III subunit beta
MKERRMKILVDELKTAWKSVAGICPARTPKDIYRYVRIDIGDDGYRLSATDGEVYVTLGECADVKLSRLLPVKLFGRVLDVCADSEIDFLNETDIVSGPDAWELPTPPVVDWCFSGVPDTGRDYRVDCDQMRDGLGVAVLAVDEESTRYALGGVLFDFIDGDTLALVSTDSRRLVVAEVDCECDGEPDRDALPVVPARAIKLLIGIMGTAGEMSFSFGVTGGIVFRTATATIHSPLVVGKYPEWRRVVPESGGEQFTFPAGELGNVLRAAAITTSEESRGLNLEFSETGIIATSKAADVGRSRVSRKMLFGAEAEMVVNPDYLLPVLAKLGSDCELTLSFIDAESPLVFSHDGGFKYVLMPLSSN